MPENLSKTSTPPPEVVVKGWDEERVFKDSAEIFSNIIQDINAARKSILVEMFIFSLDQLGRNFLDALKSASSRGVHVQIIVDGLGSSGFTDKFREQLLREDKIEVRVYKPVYNSLSKLLMNLLSFRWGRLGKLLFQMNKRNHRKVVVLDGETAWVGSANLSLSYKDWRETMVRLKGPGIETIIKGFHWVWKCACRGKRRRVQALDYVSGNVCHTFTWLNQWKTRGFKINLIKQARREIKLINPYFIPPYHLLIALLRARRRGVEVSVMTSNETDIFFVPWFSRMYYNILIKRGVRVYERKKRFLHSKILIADEQAVVGTSNYNYRSVHWDLEIDVLVNHPQTIQKLNETWQEDLSESVEVKTVSHNWLMRKLLKWLGPLRRVS